MGSGHYTITRVTQSGEVVVVRDDSGLPVTIPSSPSRSERMNIIKSLERVGVIVRGQPPASQETGATPRSSGGRLIRDDLTQFQEASAVNLSETQKLQVSLGGMGLLDTKCSRYVGTVAGWLVGVDQHEGSQLLHNLLVGKAMPPADREPFEKLEAIMSTKSNPVKHLYRLYREARGLVPGKEPVVSTIEQKNEVNQQIEEVFNTFADQLAARKDQLQAQLESIAAELEKIDNFIEFSDQMKGMLTEMDSFFGVPGAGQAEEGEDISQQPEPKHTEHHIGNGGANAQKEEQKQKVLQLMAEGGEWSQREMYEELGISQPTMSTYVRELLEENKLVVVEPGGGGTKPTTYGLPEFYSKS